MDESLFDELFESMLSFAKRRFLDAREAKELSDALRNLDADPNDVTAAAILDSYIGHIDRELDVDAMFIDCGARGHEVVG